MRKSEQMGFRRGRPYARIPIATFYSNDDTVLVGIHEAIFSSAMFSGVRWENVRR